MIDKEYGKFFINCDICGTTHRYKFNSFNEAKTEADSDGWKFKKVDGEWESYCPDCQKL